jgi:hypothetical protein
MIRQMIPEDRMAMAAGMKSMRRNAVRHLTLSERTARIRPVIVTKKGKAITQMKLLRMAVCIRSNRNMSR